MNLQKDEEDSTDADIDSDEDFDSSEDDVASADHGDESSENEEDHHSDDEDVFDDGKFENEPTLLLDQNIVQSSAGVDLQFLADFRDVVRSRRVRKMCLGITTTEPVIRPIYLPAIKSTLEERDLLYSDGDQSEEEDDSDDESRMDAKARKLEQLRETKKHLNNTLYTGALKLDTVAEDKRMKSTKHARALAKEEDGYERVIRCMFFATVQNYGALAAEQTPVFCNYFTEMVESKVRQLKPVLSKVWGDSLFMVFDSAIRCAVLATELMVAVEKTDWAKMGLPSELTLRIGMHAGPVFAAYSCKSERRNYFGRHVVHTEHMLPNVTLGCVFATKQFAACLEVEQPERLFDLQFLGEQRFDLQSQAPKQLNRKGMEWKMMLTNGLYAVNKHFEYEKHIKSVIKTLKRTSVSSC